MGFCSEMLDTFVYLIFWLLYEIFHHLQSKGATYRILKIDAPLKRPSVYSKIPLLKNTITFDTYFKFGYYCSCGLLAQFGNSEEDLWEVDVEDIESVVSVSEEEDGISRNL